MSVCDKGRNPKKHRSKTATKGGHGKYDKYGSDEEVEGAVTPTLEHAHIHKYTKDLGRKDANGMYEIRCRVHVFDNVCVCVCVCV
jgi:hypothetical protein